MGILSPNARAPQTVQPGESVFVELAIPVALTPPPGVQKASVWKDWRLVASRMADAVYGNTSKKLSYELRLLRLRPCKKNVNYVLTAEALHWLPTGEYDLTILGPGFSYSAPHALLVSAQNSMPSFLGSVVQSGEAVWQLQPDVTSKQGSWLELVVAGEKAGVELLLNGKPKPFDAVYWATHRVDRADNGRRLVRIKIPKSSSPLTLSLNAHPRGNARVVIELEQGHVRPLEWVALKAKASFQPVQVIWQFVDGDNRVGESINYRWMVGTTAIAEVTAFDQYGIPWKAKMAQPLRMPLSRTKGSCAFVAVDEGCLPLLRYLFQFWVESFVKLME